MTERAVAPYSKDNIAPKWTLITWGWYNKKNHHDNKPQKIEKNGEYYYVTDEAGATKKHTKTTINRAFPSRHRDFNSWLRRGWFVFKGRRYTIKEEDK